MAAVTLKQLLEAGVHFGHQTRRWNPRMRPYIHGEKSGIYIIDLLQTRELLQEACDFVSRLGREGRSLLFVGTKKQAQEAVAEEAVRSGMFFVNQRWLGGMLTNFSTIQTRIKRLRELEKMREDGLFEVLPKKEVAEKEREIAKLVRSLGGIKNMHRLPDAVFIIDPKKEHLAVREARKLGIPIVALVDTNCDPDEIDFVIPANDDAIKAIRLLLGAVADSILEGRKEGAASQKEAAPATEEVAAVS